MWLTPNTPVLQLRTFAHVSNAETTSRIDFERLVPCGLFPVECTSRVISHRQAMRSSKRVSGAEKKKISNYSLPVSTCANLFLLLFMMQLGSTIKHLTYFLQNIRQIRRDVSAFLLTSSQTRHQMYAYIRRLPCI